MERGEGHEEVPKVIVTSEALLVRGVLRTRRIPIEDVQGAEPCFRGGSFICVAGRRDLFTGIGLPFGPGTDKDPSFDEVVRSVQAHKPQPSAPGRGGPTMAA